MVIGVPKEVKDNEYRVGMVPAGVKALRDAGHRVLVERCAGAGSSLHDDEYVNAGAELADAAGVYGSSEMIVKVKEPRPQEYKFFREGLIIFTFFHLASDRGLADELLKTGVTAVAYETLELDNGTLPVLTPMSEVAGRLSVQIGAHYLMRPYGGRGVLISGVPGVGAGKVTIIGAGTVGVNAAKIANGLGAAVTILDTRAERFRYIDDIFGGAVKTMQSNSYNLEKSLRECDILIGAVHIPGAKTPRIVTRGMLSFMKKGSVIVDVSVDQGGCIETIKPTTHSDPAYEVDGIIHYGVTNMPGAVPRTSTFALTNATLPYVLTIARLGLKASVNADNAIKRGVNVYGRGVTHPSVAKALGKSFTPLNL